MRSNADLVRELLLEIEAVPPHQSLSRDWTDEELECLWLMNEEGLIDAYMPTDNTGYAYSADVRRLNWNGHELVKNICDEEIYEAIKAKLGSRLKDWSIGILAQFAAEYTKSLASG